MASHCHATVAAVVVAAAFAAVVAESSPHMAAFAFRKEMVSKCQEKSEISQEIVDEMQKNKGLLPDESSVAQRCFQECMAKEMGLLKNGGGVAVENIVTVLKATLQMASEGSEDKYTIDTDAVTQDLEGCEFEGEDDECINSHDTMKCLRSLGNPENMKRYITKES
ncbi:uncharacterized protein LOC126148248 [Schistocerca cancellata]|uniref:uncharacterized protein LOC126148248 n=1 Tax=Schistocerca cancellata TaxID=274614 RepID=UPI0021178B98|nr:uncharacterized protein LOC126148248 [Schistocerca cancellata]